MDISKFQLKRVNPFQGLIIDADIWQDAHNYHRNQQRLHVLAFHKTGIISGLEVAANSPADTSVNISPGIAIDPDGNTIIMPVKQRYRLQTQEKGLIYLIIQFREIPGEPYQPPDGGQPTRIVEAYRIQEINHLPSEPYVELARINYDPSQGAVSDARDPSNPARNEVNLNYREDAVKAAPEKASVQPREVVREVKIAPQEVMREVKVAPPEVVSSPPREAAVSKESLLIGYMVLGEADKNLHSSGLKNLVKSVNHDGSLEASLEETDLKKPLNKFQLIYLTGNGRFELNAEQQSALSSFLQSGGLIFGDGCSDASGGGDPKGAKEFGLSFNRYAGLLNRKLGIVQRGHSILTSEYIFAEAPQGCDPGMLLEGGNMIYGGSDYGCAWNGGHLDHPLSRDIIRSAFEIGENIISCARKGTGSKR